MILYSLYLLVFLGLIFYSGFFKLFDDPAVSRQTFSFLFLGKALAVPVFLFVFKRFYGGIENLDTGKFYHDVQVIYAYGKTDPGFLLRFLVGLQDDLAGSADYDHVFKNTLNWDNGTVKDYLYNDNRIVIRTHVILNFLAFDFYPVHALFNCFLSFTGIFFFYKTFKEWFKNKETGILCILCFFPALWFYTGALLKEGLTFFILGCALYSIKKFIDGERNFLRVFLLLFLFFISLLLKPYLLIYAEISFAAFFSICRSQKITRKTLVFFSLLAFAVLTANTISVLWKHRSLTEAALKQQHRFIGVSRGGIFVSDSVNFIRLTNDTNQLIRVSHKKDIFRIKKDVNYMYWKTVEQLDTLYCFGNKDTTTLYQLAYIIQPSNSNIHLPDQGVVQIMMHCLYYTLFYPAFYNAKNALQFLASFENLVILIALLIIIFGLSSSKKQKFLPLVFIFFALSFCILIGLTAPNSGAIFRYRSPAMVFLLLSALYYSEEVKTTFFGSSIEPGSESNTTGKKE